MRVRAADPDEWRAIQALRVRALETDPDAFWVTPDQERARPERHWRAWIGAAGAPVFVPVGDDDVPAGLAKAQPQPDGLWVFALWVAPEARRAGAALALVERCCAHARAEALDVVRLGVAEDNRAARALYDRLGFTESGSWRRMPRGAVELDLELRVR